MAFTQISATDLADLQAQLLAWLVASAGWSNAGANKVQNADGYKWRVAPGGNVARAHYPEYLGAVVNLIDNHFHVYFDNTTVGGVGESVQDNVGNDWHGPFPNVWFFATNKYCHVVAQVATNRYNHMSFGSLDDRGISPFPIAYFCGIFYKFWADNIPTNHNNFAPNAMDKVGNPHYYGHYHAPNNTYYHVGFPDNVLETSLGFGDGPVSTNGGLLQTSQLMPLYSQAVTGANAFGYALDFIPAIENQSATGGVPIIPIPWAIYAGDGGLCWLGELPNMGACQLNGLSAGQTISYAGDEWLVFPLKQLGLADHTKYGGNPMRDVNTVNHGFAYKKA